MTYLAFTPVRQLPSGIVTVLFCALLFLLVGFGLLFYTPKEGRGAAIVMGLLLIVGGGLMLLLFRNMYRNKQGRNQIYSH